MEFVTLASLIDTLNAVWLYLTTPIVEAPWSAWREFWLERVFDRHFVVVYFLPLLPVLMLLRGDRLRRGIILTGVVFLIYVFGVLHAALWLVTCVLLHRLGERFAYECKRTDVLQIGPPIAAWTIIGGGYLIAMLLHRIHLPDALNAWLAANVPWIYPMGVRGFAWEPFFGALHHARGEAVSAQLFQAIFWDLHFVGTAYLAVRMFQYFSEIRRGNLPPERRTLLNFLAFTCYAPTLIQGPIERFVPFQDEMDTCHLRRSWKNVLPAFARIGQGLLKSIVLELYFRPILLDELGLLRTEQTYYKHPEELSGFFLYTGIVFQILWLYLEFSGYCDIAAGMARLLGYRQFENFRYPWLSTSLRDFWRRWHLSLSFILRDYIYIALGGNRRHTTLNLIITFVGCGLWHRVTPNAALWGLMMALMVALNQYWVKWMDRLDQRKTGWLPAVRRSWIKVPVLPQLCAWLVTMHALNLTLLVLFGGTGSINVINEILHRLWQWIS
jgi:D-alanyl-lipoteichoic acid acyltransferase DltB (MBOAT superfamily)